MMLFTIAFLCYFSPNAIMFQSHIVDYSKNQQNQKTTLIIDSSDYVIFDLDRYIVEGNIVQIPVFIESDEIINALDFSMQLDTQHLEFESVVDHTGDLQFAAFMNPADLKLRFTSNSFTPYPKDPHKVVSLRFIVHTGTVTRSDFEMLVAYLNGDKCSIQLEGKDISLSTHHIVVNENFATPNPASDFISINADEEGILDMFDIHGMAVIRGYRLKINDINSVDVQRLPRGSYTLRIVSGQHSIKVQKMVLQ